MAKGKKETTASKAKSPAAKKAGKPAVAAKSGVGAALKSVSKEKKTAAKSGTGAAPKSAAKTKTAGVKSRTPKPAKIGAAKNKAGKKKLPSLPHLNDKMLRQIVEKLDEMRAESERMVNLHLQEDLKNREESGDVGDDMDQASNEREREFSLIIHQRHLRRLVQVDEAFNRIEDGVYGLCEGTEEPIDPKRLLIMPLARYSIEYQQQQEKMLGRSPDDGIGMSEETMISDE